MSIFVLFIPDNKNSFNMTAQNRLMIMAFAFLAIQACSPYKSSTYHPRSEPVRNTGNKNPGPSGPGYNPGVSQIRTEIADYGQKFVGVNYKYGGQSPGTGFDCSGFTSYVLKGFGYTISPASAVQATTGDEVSLSRVQPGDLLFFGSSRKKIQHVALIVKRTDDGIVCVHSTTSRGVIVENVSQSSDWKPKILLARSVVKK